MRDVNNAVLVFLVQREILQLVTFDDHDHHDIPHNKDSLLLLPPCVDCPLSRLCRMDGQ